MKKLKHIFLTLVVFFTTLNVIGQNYPIQSFVQISPPYSSYLPDYADPFNNQMKVLLTLTDFTVASHQVKIKITLTGNGYSITTNDFLNLPPITVTPGVPVEISGSSLAPYLATENLIFTGIDVNDYIQRKVLPEGPCTICIEVTDFSSPNNVVIGTPACAFVWFNLFEPPQLISPIKYETLIKSYPHQIVFSWTSMSMGSPSNLTKEYVLELFQDFTNPDENIDPNVIVNSSAPVYTEVTNQTFLLYTGLISPQFTLIEGDRYIWRVQERNNEGRDLYVNQTLGYSESRRFTYGSLAASLADGIELQLQTNGTGVRQGYANWNANGVFTHYILEVRKTGDPNFEWFTYSTDVGVPITDMKINSLEPETEYEARIKGLINDEFESEYSNISVFTTNPPPNYACGTTTMPATAPNIVPLDNAIVGQTFTVGQFDMRVTSIESLGQAGHFKGTGKITMPFIMMQLNVSFQDILVDDNLTIREGKVEAITKGIDAWEHDLLVNMATPHYVPSMDTTMIQYDSTGVTINFEGVDSVFTFPGGGVPIVLNAAGGLQYIVWPDGTIEIGTWNVSDDNLDATKDYFVYFKADNNQAYGFDAFNNVSQSWEGNYENILLKDGTPYYVSYKSTAKNDGDFVIAKFETDSTVSDLTFIISGEEISGDNITVIDDKTYKIDLNGYMQEHSKDLYAYDGNSRKIGKLRVITYADKEIDIVVVPVGNSTINLPHLQDSLNDIYACANTHFNVSIASPYNDQSWNLNGDGKMEIADPELFSLYSDEMKAIRTNYFADTSYNKHAIYLFVIDEFDTPDVEGYMVHNKALGFITPAANERTVAHEIGHGAFDLPHTFPDVTEGSTNNLMDYADGNHLTKVQWEQIFSNTLSFSFLDDAEDGELMTLNVDNYNNIFELKNDDGSITFLSIAGIPITLSGDISKLKFVTYEDKWETSTDYIMEQSFAPIGALAAFEIDGKYYQASGQTIDQTFLGYKNEETQSLYIDSLSKINSYYPILVIPSYSMVGFRGDAFRIQKTTNKFLIDSLNKANGTIEKKWAFMPYISESNLKNSVKVVPIFSTNFSFETLTILSDLLYNNDLVSNQPTFKLNNDFNLYELELPENLSSPFGNNDEENYYGYEALICYEAAYLIESMPESSTCFTNFNFLVSTKQYGELYYEIYKKFHNDLYPSQMEDPPLILPSPVNVMFEITLPDNEKTYKKRKLEEIIGGIAYYNYLLTYKDLDEQFNDLETEAAITQYIELNQMTEGLGDCLLRLLNAPTKVKIIKRIFNYSWSDNKEELVVKIVENTTDEQFAKMWPYFVSNDCFLSNSLMDDLWFSHYDRFMNRLSLLIVNYQKSLPNYNYSNIPSFNIHHDGMLPGDDATEFELNGCYVTLKTLPFGVDIDDLGVLPYGVISNLGTTFKAWDLVKFRIKDDFKFPGYNGQQLKEGDMILAPAIWAYYFLDEDAQHVNTQIFTYIASAFIIIATEGAGTPLAIELSVLGGSYVLATASDNYPNNELLSQMSTIFDHLTIATILKPSAVNALGLSGKLPFITKITSATKTTFKITISEITSYLKIIRGKNGAISNMIKNIDNLLIILNNSQITSNLKNQFITTLLIAQINAKVIKYSLPFNKAVLVAQDNLLQIKLNETVGNYGANELFEIGSFGLKNNGDVYLFNPHLFNPNIDGNVNEIIGVIEDIPIKENNVFKTQSFEVVYTSNNHILLKQLANAVGKSNLLSKLSSHPNITKLVNRLDDVTDASLITKIDDLVMNNPSKLSQLEDLYSPSKFKLPSDRPIINGVKKNGDFTIQRTIEGENISIYYNKEGFPDFKPFSPGDDYKFMSNSLSGSATDMTLANNSVLNKFAGNPNKFKWNGQTTWFEIKNVDGNWVKYTWHHVEDGRTMIPIPSKIHNATNGGFSHTGGKAIIIRQLQDFFN